VKCLPLPARSSNLNAHAERWVPSIKGLPVAADPVRGEVVAARGVEIIWNIITRNEITKARTICYCSRSLLGRQVREAQSVVESGSAVYSNITAAPPEYFYHKGIGHPLGRGRNRRYHNCETNSVNDTVRSHFQFTTPK
jgi:hypothetical protein